MSEFEFPVNKIDLRQILKSYLDRIGRKIKVFENNLPGLTWVSIFFKKKSDFKCTSSYEYKEV